MYYLNYIFIRKSKILERSARINRGLDYKLFCHFHGVLVEDICLVEEKKNGNGKGGSYLKTKNIWLVEKKNKREGKGRKYLKKEGIFYAEEKKLRRNRRKIFGDGKNVF